MFSHSDFASSLSPADKKYHNVYKTWKGSIQRVVSFQMCKYREANFAHTDSELTSVLILLISQRESAFVYLFQKFEFAQE